MQVLSQRRLTPRQRLRQLVASWFFKGQTTSLFWSETEKELVRELLGGMAVMQVTLGGGKGNKEAARSATMGAPIGM